MQEEMYWFRPIKFWKIFAFYYPANRIGWAVSMFLIVALTGIFSFINNQSHSIEDTLFQCAPWAIAFGAIFDLLCFRFGEYPSWWRKKKYE